MVEKEVKIKVAADVDDGQVKALEELLDSLADKVVGFEVAVEDGEIDGALEKEDELNTTAEVDIEVNDAGIQVAMQNIKDGIFNDRFSYAYLSCDIVNTFEVEYQFFIYLFHIICFY